MTHETTEKDGKLTVKEAAKYLSVSDDTIRRLIQRKKLTSYRTNERNTTVQRADLDRYLKELNAPTEPTKG